jgi:two-component system, NarL family, nitrate/nitrite response regulator NarL
MELVVGGRGTLLTDLLEPTLVAHGHTVAVGPPTRAGLVPIVATIRPGAVIADHLGDTDRDVARFVRALREAGEGRTAVVVLTSDGHRASVDAALAAGARAYLHRSHGVESLLRALRRVQSGEVMVTAPRAQHDQDPEGARARRLVSLLTERELECLSLLVDGVSTHDMERRLGIATLTVRSHVQSMLSKLGVHSRLEAASLAVRHDLLRGRALPSRAG